MLVGFSVVNVMELTILTIETYFIPAYYWSSYPIPKDNFDLSVPLAGILRQAVLFLILAAFYHSSNDYHSV